MESDVKYLLIISLLITTSQVVAQDGSMPKRVELEQIDPRVDQQVDLAVDLALDIQHSDDTLQPASDIRRVYSVRGLDRPLFARRSGGLTAVFPRAWIQRGDNGQFHTPIPDGTTFYIGPFDPKLGGGLIHLGPRDDAPEQQRPIDGRLLARTYPAPLESRIALQDAAETLELRLSRWSPSSDSARSLLSDTKARRLGQLVYQASQMRRFKQLADDDRRRQRNQDSEAASQASPSDDSHESPQTMRLDREDLQSGRTAPLEKEEVLPDAARKEDSSQFESSAE